MIGPRGAGKSTLLDGIAYSLGDTEVVDVDRNNYIGYTCNYELDDIVTADVKNSSSGDREQVLPTTGDTSGFVFDYYHQKYIGWLANPRQEDELSTFLFDRIFRSTTDAETLFADLDSTRTDTIEDLRLNRESIRSCIIEITKEQTVRDRIAQLKSQKEFLSQKAIRDLLDQRNIIVSLEERVRRIVDRLARAELEPIVGGDEIVDVDFFEDLQLTSLDPDKRVLPTAWEAVESDASALTEASEQDQKRLRDQFSELRKRIVAVTGEWRIRDELEAVFATIKEGSSAESVGEFRLG